MATYNELTTEQKEVVQDLANYVRGSCRDLTRLMAKAAAITSKYSGNVENILAAITDGNEVIQETSDLAGAQSMTKTELVNLIGYFITMSATADGASGSYNTNYHRSLYAKAAGINAVQ